MDFLPPAATRRRSRWVRWTAGGSLAAAAAVALTVWLARPQTQLETVATPVGQRQSLTLADGTRIDLNAQTNLQVEITGRTRHVLLASVETVFRRWLQPLTVPADRGDQVMHAPLPARPAGSRLRLRVTVGPNGNNAWDWAYMTAFGFR